MISLRLIGFLTLAVGIGVLLTACGQADAHNSNGDPENGTTSEGEGDSSTNADYDTVYFAGYGEVLDIFESKGYSYDGLREGDMAIPRYYITEIPNRWRKSSVKEVEVAKKKELFVHAILPLILKANEIMLDDRNTLMQILREKDVENWSAEDMQWVKNACLRFNVIKDEEQEVDLAKAEELLNRTDVIPPSLAISQSALESGWGTSMYSAQGNSLFGQMSWSKDAIRFRQEESPLIDYGLATFETPQESVLAYVYNLNTHHAYREFRAMRADMRARGEVPSGRELASTLKRYSSRGQGYIDHVITMMNSSELDITDSTFLANGEPVFLVPEGDL